MNDEMDQQDGASVDSSATKFRNWRGTLNCGFTGETCRLSVAGDYFLGMRSGWRKLEKRRTDFDPTLFAIDVVDTDGPGDPDWIMLEGEFEAGPDVKQVILEDEHGNRHQFPVGRM